MTKLNVPQNTWIQEVEIGFLKEGFFNGVYGLEVTFSGGTCPGDDFIATLAEEVFKQKFPSRKIARFKGLYPKDDKEIELLVQLLKNWGFSVQAIINDGYQGTWLARVDWIIAKLTKQFSLSPANEIWYFPPAAESIKEPRIPPNKQTLLYISKGHSVPITTKFVYSAEHSWNLL